MEWITKNEVYNKLARWVHTSESYYLRRHEGRVFSQVGVTYLDRYYDRYGGRQFPLFSVYTGNRELYLKIREMVHEVADELNRPFIFDQWQDENESEPSDPVVGSPSSRERTGGVCCGAAVTGTCPSVIDEVEGIRIQWVP